MKNSNTFLKLVDDQGRVKTTAFMPETFKFWIQPVSHHHLIYSPLSASAAVDRLAPRCRSLVSTFKKELASPCILHMLVMRC